MDGTVDRASERRLSVLHPAVTTAADGVRDLPRSRRLAAFLAGLDIDDLPDGAARLLKLCILDHIGCALGACDSEGRRMVASYLSQTGESGPCSVYGAGRAGPQSAALANGTLAHILIFDDLHRQAKLHPGVAVIPACLAAAEIASADGRTLLAGIAAGYEAAARVGVAVGLASHRKKGWRATGTCGSFGAAIGAARVLRLDEDRTHQALAGAAAQACGAWAFQESGGMELYLAAGTAARNGIAAALLAKAGFRGADDPLEAADGGFFMMSSDASDPAVLDQALGSQFRLCDTCIKMHPTCHSTLTGIDAVLNLRERHALALEDVERIVVRAGEITRLQCGWPFAPAPAARMIFHMGFALAVALRNGKVRPSDFDRDTMADPELGRVARATEVVADPELTRVYAQRKPCDVTLYLRDGRTLRERVDFCIGEPENPPSENTVTAKFHDLAGRRLPNSATGAIADFIMSIERQRDLSPLSALLNPVG